MTRSLPGSGRVEQRCGGSTITQGCNGAGGVAELSANVVLSLGAETGTEPWWAQTSSGSPQG
ncbi:hypothetical protein [Rhodococcus sp. CH91]|uniref:hypothetical protein n=1 Tax=Rhodococcus sp. CH91 TaxID=2910256 RepID=UPI001F4A91B5|nr:hypothetical protein [Rhodococcus sp. CH91]